MKNKRKIYIVSENEKLIKNIRKITKDIYNLENITGSNKKINNSVVLYDLTESKLSNKNFLNKTGLSEKKIKEFLDNNLSSLAVIDESQLNNAQKILDAGFEDFLVLPLNKIKILATFNNTLRNVEYTEELNKLYRIGKELSAEKNLDKLLQRILSTCCDITVADGGSIYIVLPGLDRENKLRILSFQYSRSDTLGNIYEKFTIPVNKNSISGYVACTKKTLNIENCYKIPKKAEYKFFKDFDKANNYETRSMITVPMINHIGDVIGVVQLVNRKKVKKIKLDSKDKMNENVIPFDIKCERLLESLTSQAAIGLENTMLYKELKDIFDSFIEASALAVESRDPTTAGHSRRVSMLCVSIAREINNVMKGPLAKIKFNDDEILVLRYSALLHDFGKIGVTEHILTKGEKLLLGEFENIKERFETIRYHIGTKIKNEANKEKELLKIDGYFKLLEKAKKPGHLTDAEKTTLKKLAKQKYVTVKGEVKPYLTDKELKSYLIENGSLTEQEKRMIKTHVLHSFKFLDEIPWPSTLKNIPKIAFTHHELIDGSGYPNKLNGKEIPIEAQIMSVADVYDALISSDRPYKKRMDIKTALKIIKDKAAHSKLNMDIVNLFITRKLYKIVTLI